MKFFKPVHGPPGMEASFFASAFAELEVSGGLKVFCEAPDWKSWLSRLADARSRGIGADVIYVPQGWIPTLAELDVLSDLTRCAQVSGLDITHWQRNYAGNIWDMGSYRGKQYGIPVYGAVWCFMYNKSLLAEAGCDNPPRTWEELEQCVRKLRAVLPGIWPYGVNDDSDGHFIDHAYIFLLAGGLAQLTRHHRCSFDNEWSIKGLEMLDFMTGREWWKDRWPCDKLFAAFMNGEVAMTVGPAEWVLRQREQNPHFPLGISMMPAPIGGKPLSLASYGMYCIPAESERMEEALRCIEHMTLPSTRVRHASAVGALPIHHFSDSNDNKQDPAFEIFHRQVLLSGELPKWPFAYTDWLTQAMESVLSGKIKAGDALHQVTERINEYMGET